MGTATDGAVARSLRGYNRLSNIDALLSDRLPTLRGTLQMASRAFHDLLLHCQDNLSRNGRGTFMAVVGLLLFHLLVITPFADAGRRKVDAAADRQRLATVGPDLAAIEERLEAAREASLAAFRPALDDFTEQLALDFARLEASRWRWQQEGEEGSPGGDDPDGTALGASLEMAPPPRGTVPLDIDETRRLALAEAPNRYALLSLLEPLVDEEIVAPRWAALERAWRAEALPPLISGLDAAGAEISQLRGQFPEAEAAWDPLSVALTELSRQAQAWSPELPATPFWWASPESAPQLSLGLGDLEDRLRRPPGLAKLAVSQQQVVERLHTVHRAWERRQADIPPADAASSGFLGLDLDGLSPLFPLALGLLLAAAGWRRSRLLADLAKAVQVAIQHGSPPQLAAWFGGQAAPGQPLTAPLGRLAGSASGRLWLAGLLAWGWIGLAGHQLYGPPTADWRPWLPALAGAGLVLLTTVHRSIVLRRAFALLAATGDVSVDGSRESFGTVDDATSPMVGTSDDGSLMSPAPNPEDDLVETTLRR